MTIQSPPRAVLGTPYRPYRRGVDNALLGGVCGGLAIRLGVKERTIRIVFSLLALVAGVGLMLYMLIWLGVPRSGEGESIVQRLLGKRRQLQRIVITLVCVTLFLIAVHSLTMFNIGVYTWPALLSLVAFAGIWRGASPDERRHLEELAKSAPVIGVPATRTKRAFFLRLVLAALLVFVGYRVLESFNSGRNFPGVGGSTVSAIFGTLIILAGVLVLLAPWWLATLSDLTGERRARVRIEERANVAAHLHDSVLQTLTLIERAAGDEVAVVRLARNQERELREWLFNPDAGTGESDDTFTTLMHRMEAEIENDYGVRVELVTVGDCALDDDVVALVAAAREAAINAARWSEAKSVFVFAEVEDGTVSLFVRDKGKGFDVATVPSDRQGIVLSIRQRILARGGTVSISSTPGEGTDVQLSIPRTP